MDLQTLKKVAREQLQYAVMIGRIKKPVCCEVCNKIRFLQGHHPSYAQPLNVVWCCVPCHATIHGLTRRGMKYRSRWGKGLLKPNDS